MSPGDSAAAPPLLPTIEIRPVWLEPFSEAAMASFRRLLSAEETARASRLKADIHRSRYEARRGVLRILLARYTNRQPEEIELVSGQWGKPAMRGSEIGFNLSHSQGLAVYAFGPEIDLGIDVELVRGFPYLEQVARHALSDAETAGLLALPAGPAREAHFFRCWTRKEAFAKLTGLGLTVTPPSIPWTLHPFEPAPGYVGALAYPPAADKFPVAMLPATSALQILAAFEGSGGDRCP